MKFLNVCILLILFISLQTSGQDYFFRQYANESGLYHSFVYAINQDRDGFLWMGTGDGLYRFNGFEFEYFSSELGLAGNFVTNIFRDQDGKLWIGHQNGTVSVLSGKSIIALNEGFETQGSVSDIAQDDKGFIWVLVQHQGLVRINEDFVIHPVSLPFEDETLTQIAYLGNDHFLVGSQENIFLCRSERTSGKMLLVSRIEEYPGSKVVEILRQSPGHYLVIGQDYGFHGFQFDSLSATYEFSFIDGNADGALDNLQGGVIDNKGTLWLNSLGNGLIKYSIKGQDFTRTGKVTTVNGLVSDDVRSMFVDDESNLWVGMYGEGLLKLVENNLTFFSLHPESESNRTYTITGDDKSLQAVSGDRLWYISRYGDTLLDSYPLPISDPGERVNTAFIADDGSLWLGFEYSGLYVFSPSAPRFRAVFLSKDELANSVNHVTGKGDHIWVGTKKGICRINKVTGNKEWFTTENELPHNNIQQVYIDSQGRVLMATMCHEIHYIDGGEIGRLEAEGMDQSIQQVVSISEGSDSAIWAGTLGNGVWRIKNGKAINYNRASGLVSDYCYSLAHTREGMLLVGHRGGVSLIDPVTKKIRIFGRLEGIKSSADFYPNAVYTDNLGNIWFGTSEGLLKYNSAPPAESTTPPRLHLVDLHVDDVIVDHTAGEIILKPGHYELAVDYIGINFSNPEMVTYQTKLEGYSKNWSDITSDRRAVYEKVGYGEYTFMIRAFDENGLSSELSSAFTLRIKKPPYLNPWMYAIAFVLIVSLVYIFVKQREKKQKQFQIMLQNKLDERTREVVRQKEKIEIINKDLKDSIVYAQKIQASILPPVSRLKERFSGAFIYFQPKDIVSGDFYWFERFGHDTLIIVCADATGHGVPGAFMSLIGSTLIKDICSREYVVCPSRGLDLLDKEVMKVLSQNLEEGGSNDGMDIRITKININSLDLRTASAMMPMVIYQEDEPIHVSSNRISIGGLYEGFEEKTFDSVNYKLNKGDKIYMFTDGYSDQFGGPEGKKFKSGNVKKMLDEIHAQPMDEQYHHIKHTFESWKRDFEQVDDVLFMGIEI
jgi:ligand-binding sensor domain-containing protein/serine phosphatase RsbU (regulator of sigma subunit)